jgi:hypothetical protein
MVDLEGTLVLDGVATPYADDSSIANSDSALPRPDAPASIWDCEQDPRSGSGVHSVVGFDDVVEP